MSGGFPKPRTGDYTNVTEVPGLRATREQISMLYTRYRMAAMFCEGKDVLEVACGAGLGLGYLAQKARRVVGGDYTERLLRLAQRHYGSRIPLIRLDAHDLPFKNEVFDVVLLYEAIYYLQDPEKFFLESRRVLRPGGYLLLSTVNREWAGFIPSPYSVNYLTAGELYKLLARCGFSAELFAGFPVTMGSVRDRVISWMRHVAALLDLMPRTLKGRAVLKRLFFGRLVAVPPEVTDEMTDFNVLVPIDYNSSIPNFKIIYAFGQRM